MHLLVSRYDDSVSPYDFWGAFLFCYMFFRSDTLACLLPVRNRLICGKIPLALLIDRTAAEVDIIHPAKGMGVSVLQVGIQSVRFYKSAVSATADIPQGIDDRGTVFLLSGAA